MSVYQLNDTSLTVILSGGVAGDFKVSVVRAGYGKAVPTNSTTNDFSYKIEVSGVTPNTGSIAGGTVLTISGVNFSPVLNENQVYIGRDLIDTTVCDMLTSTATEITCRTRKCPVPVSNIMQAGETYDPKYIDLSNEVIVTQRVY